MRVLRADGDEVGRKLDLAVFQVHCVAEIDYVVVVRIRHREREINAPSDSFVGSSVAELLAAENIGARRNLDAKHPRVELHDGQNKNHEQGD